MPWINRHEYETLRERLLKAETRLETVEYLKDVLQDRLLKRDVRIKMLEGALLKANDDVQSTRKDIANRPPQPVNLAALFDDEDEELVAKDRRRAEAEGTTDGLLATMDE